MKSYFQRHIENKMHSARGMKVCWYTTRQQINVLINWHLSVRTMCMRKSKGFVMTAYVSSTHRIIYFVMTNCTELITILPPVLIHMGSKGAELIFILLSSYKENIDYAT